VALVVVVMAMVKEVGVMVEVQAMEVDSDLGEAMV
jgi:hypothetical protein